SAFLAEASNVLVRSLDYEAIPRGLARHAVPFLGDLCAVALVDDVTGVRWRCELAWVGRSDEEAAQSASSPGLEPGPLDQVVRHVSGTGEWEVFRLSVGNFELGEGGRAASSEQPEAGRGDPRRQVPGTNIAPHAVLALPLCARGHCLGVIVLAFGENRG